MADTEPASRADIDAPIPQEALDLSRAVDLLAAALQDKEGWRERALDFLEEMIPGEREYLDAQRRERDDAYKA